MSTNKCVLAHSSTAMDGMKGLIALFLALLALFSRGIQGKPRDRLSENERQVLKEFQIWEKNFKVGYSKHNTAMKRFEIWKQNKKYIQEYNQFESSKTGIKRNSYRFPRWRALTIPSTHTVAMNQFGDLTNREFQKLHTSLRRNNETVTVKVGKIKWGRIRWRPASYLLELTGERRG